MRNEELGRYFLFILEFDELGVIGGGRGGRGGPRPPQVLKDHLFPLANFL